MSIMNWGWDRDDLFGKDNGQINYLISGQIYQCWNRLINYDAYFYIVIYIIFMFVNVLAKKPKITSTN